jgi:hypothetical protein
MSARDDISSAYYINIQPIYVVGFVFSAFLDCGFISEANSELVRLLALCSPDFVLIFRFVMISPP